MNSCIHADFTVCSVLEKSWKLVGQHAHEPGIHLTMCCVSSSAPETGREEGAGGVQQSEGAQEEEGQVRREGRVHDDQQGDGMCRLRREGCNKGDMCHKESSEWRREGVSSRGRTQREGKMFTLL